MKIAVVYNTKDIKVNKKCELFFNKIYGISNVFCKKIDIIDDLENLNIEYDIYVLITNTIYDVMLYKKKNKVYRKTLILTENTNSQFVILCINYTKNLMYFNLDFETIFQKINDIYKENLNK